jgi:hypothetical protein
MSAVYSNLAGGPERPSVIDLARQLVKISRSLEDVERDDAQAPSWNQVFFHEPPLSEKNAAHWLATAMDGAHVGQIVPLSACLILFAQWMHQLETGKRDREQVFIDLYYKKTLGYTNKANETDLMLASRAEVDLESRRRILTVRDIAPVVASRCGTMLLNERVVNVHAGERVPDETPGEFKIDVHLKLNFEELALKDMPSYTVLQNILDNMVAIEINEFIKENARQVARLNKQLTLSQNMADAYVNLITNAMKAGAYEKSGIDRVTDFIDEFPKWAIIPNLISNRLKALSKTKDNKEAALAALVAKKDDFKKEVREKLDGYAKGEVAKLDQQAADAADRIEAKIVRLRDAWETVKNEQRKRVKNITSPFVLLSVKFPLFPVAPVIGIKGIREMVGTVVNQELSFQLSQDDNLVHIFDIPQGSDAAANNHPRFGGNQLEPPKEMAIVPLNTPHLHIRKDLNDHEIWVNGKRVILDVNKPDVFEELDKHNDAKLAAQKKEILAEERKDLEAMSNKWRDEMDKLAKTTHDDEMALARKIEDVGQREVAAEASQEAYRKKLDEYKRQHEEQLDEIARRFSSKDDRLDELKSNLVESESTLGKLRDKEASDTAGLRSTLNEIERRRQEAQSEFLKFVEEQKVKDETSNDAEKSKGLSFLEWIDLFNRTRGFPF